MRQKANSFLRSKRFISNRLNRLAPNWEGIILLSTFQLEFPVNTFCFGTSFFHELWPRHHVFNAFGLIYVVRHIEEQGLKILEDVQVILFGSFNDAVHNGAGFRAIHRVMEKEVLPADDIAFHLTFRTLCECSDKPAKERSVPSRSAGKTGWWSIPSPERKPALLYTAL